MRLLYKEKLAELLTQNWTKFIDYKTLMSFAINSVKLYAKNWAMLEYEQKNKTNKIMISRTCIQNNLIMFWLDFEVIVEKNLSIGTIEFTIDLNGNFELKEIKGNVFYSN